MRHTVATLLIETGADVRAVLQPGTKTGRVSPKASTEKA
ncbi:hypothetical protein CULT_2260003 [[Clostridium] ultunense Esp]|nr:hypothetical protein CULT_2260003 [[Clostridium] ultunense Esp]